MKVNICNCNNIKSYEMEIQENKLNIKYGPNGTGKSTVSNAIKEKLEGGDLSKFKHYVLEELPSISYDNTKLKNVLIYNEDYINQFLFISENNIHENVFNVFAKTSDYDEKIQNINDKLARMKEKIILNEKIDKFILNYNLIDKEIRITTTNKLAQSGVVKSLTNGNKILNVPNDLTNYEFLMKSDLKIKWYDWYQKGFEFYNKKTCPFCTANNNDLVSQKEEIDKLFIKADVNNITNTSNIIKDIKEFLSNDATNNIEKILNNSQKLDDKEKKYLLDLKLEYKYIFERLQKLKDISYLSITKLDDIKKYIMDLKFDFNMINKFKSDKFMETLKNTNKCINDALLGVNEIIKETNVLNSSIKVYIKKNENSINDFLLSIGMSYEVKIERESIKLIFKNSNVIVDPKTHLSWGEKNSFALALFLFDCLYQDPNLIILDDPVSSFDNNKKYGIIHYLFNKNNSLRNKTVMLFSHDIEPIINFYKKNKSVPNYVVSYSLSNNKGVISEKSISSNDILSIIDTCKNSAKNNSLNTISRLINCRRLFELENDCNEAYNILSCLFHNKEKITTLDDSELTDIDIQKGIEDIRKLISDFDYQKLQKKFKTKEFMKNAYNEVISNYEKIEIFRLINTYFKLDGSDDNIMKFINETYHIENSFVFQLNPYIYNIVPNYILEICDKKISEF